MTKRVLWVIFGVIFYISGDSFFTWLLEPENFNGGFYWVLLIIFPFIAPLSFFINRKLGCAACASGTCNIETRSDKKDNDDFLIGTGQMP
jgi:hypothetical protein